MRKDRGMYQELCNSIGKYLEPKMNVLELACGTGQLSFPLAEKTHQWEATDFSEKMIQRAKAGRVPRNLYFSVQDATRLPYGDGFFDAVVIANALHIMPHPELALTEIHRVLKKDGLLFAPTFVSADHQHEKRGRHWIEQVGFRTFYEWDENEYINFLTERGFDLLEHKLIPGKRLTECSAVLSRK
ncbi:MAG: class I SAM-dependent methyltransferase [Lachnospiraceae bacterium]|nr:class I SAM-dependent methyltransferase [Lachnospiraceae bacterium]